MGKDVMRRIFLSAGCLALLSLSACQSASSLLDAGNACYIRGDFVGSLDHYSAARRKDPTLPEIDQKIRLAELRLLIQRGDLAVQRSNWQEAERAYQEARRLDPGSEEVAERFQRMAAARANQRFLKGQELLLAGNALEAAAEFEQALVFQPDH